MSSKKCIVLIDGSNFYFKLKDLELHDLLKFNFSAFIKHLVGKEKVIQSTYYVGRIQTSKESKAKKLHANQQRLLAHLKIHKIEYTLGYFFNQSFSISSASLSLLAHSSLPQVFHQLLAFRNTSSPAPNLVPHQTQSFGVSVY